MSHDSANAYEPDTHVLDVPDEPSRPRRSKAITDGALTMQILSEGNWHRRTPDLKTTACGRPYHSQFAPPRRESYEGRLCRECFTSYELAINEQLNEQKKEGTR